MVGGDLKREPDLERERSLLLLRGLGGVEEGEARGSATLLAPKNATSKRAFRYSQRVG